MKLLIACPNCDSSDVRPWSRTARVTRLHYAQSRCRSCGLVFSNPVCERVDLEGYYRKEYWESHWPTALDRDAGAVEHSIQLQTEEVQRIQRLQPGGRLLEVGAGTGSFLAAARRAGFRVAGIETSTAAVQHAREVFGLDTVVQGSLPDVELEEGSFDVVYAWHVIEHVLDLNGFVSALRRLLRPNGLLWLGTENYQNATHYFDKIGNWLRSLPPPFATATEHTLAFTPNTLRNVLTRRGFETLSLDTYQPSLEEKLRTMSFRSSLTKGYFVAQHALNALFTTGPLMRLVARPR